MNSIKLRIAPRKTVTIKQEHIDHADRNKSRTCAIAAALSESGVLRPVVHRGRIAFTVNGERFTYIVPPSMATFITQFDKHGAKAVKPSSLQLREGVVSKAKRTGGPDRTEKARHAPGGRQARKGYTGPRGVVVTNVRMDGFAVAKPTRRKR